MKETNINKNTGIKTGRSRVREDDQAKVELSRGTLLAAGTFTALIGIWVAACFIGGLAASGGPIALLKSWFAAIAGG